MSCFVNRHVVLTFEDEVHCIAFRKRIREMFIRHSSHARCHDDMEEITLDAVGEDEVDWSDRLGYVFRGRNEEERLVRIWTMGREAAKIRLYFKDVKFESNPRTLSILGDDACLGPELFSCFRQYLDGDFGLEGVQVLFWSEYDSIDFWNANEDGSYFYSTIDSDGFNAKREALAQEQGIDVDDALEIDGVEVLEATGLLEDGSEYAAYCKELDNLDMDAYPVFYDADVVVSSTEPEAESSSSNAEAGPRFCEQCGAALEVGSAFCTQCGASIDDAPVRSDGERMFYLPGWMRRT